MEKKVSQSQVKTLSFDLGAIQSSITAASSTDASSISSAGGTISGDAVLSEGLVSLGTIDVSADPFWLDADSERFSIGGSGVSGGVWILGASGSQAHISLESTGTFSSFINFLNLEGTERAKIGVFPQNNQEYQGQSGVGLSFSSDTRHQFAINSAKIMEVGSGIVNFYKKMDFSGSSLDGLKGDYSQNDLLYSVSTQSHSASFLSLSDSSGGYVSSQFSWPRDASSFSSGVIFSAGQPCGMVTGGIVGTNLNLHWSGPNAGLSMHITNVGRI
jgi:hypothetical protein